MKTLLAFYGDDFTGTTATAEALTESHVSTMIFAEPPTASFLIERFPEVRAVGVAGTSRTMHVDELEATLAPAFKIMKDYRAPVFLYKVCSTFDSSKIVGNIGRAIEIAREIFSSDFVPILPAAPRLGRFTVFGHHFAALGRGRVYRLDRHPSIANHPITPMKESDLRLHLSKQTELESGLIDIFTLDKGKDHVHSSLDEFIAKSIPIIFFDCLYEQHLILACKVIWERATQKSPVFLVGSQELAYGLGRTWRDTGLIPVSRAHYDDKNASNKGPIFVLSGSCATVTGKQIQWAVENGFVDIGIQPQNLLDPVTRFLEQERVIRASVSSLHCGCSVVAHTAIGTSDSRIDLMTKKAARLSLSCKEANEILGDALGVIALDILQLSNLKRFVVVGGDTAGRIQKHLGIQALQIARPVGIAAPLCYVYTNVSGIQGLEIAFKGGQVGSANYFGEAQAAKTLDFQVAALGKF